MALESGQGRERARLRVWPESVEEVLGGGSSRSFRFVGFGARRSSSRPACRCSTSESTDASVPGTNAMHIWLIARLEPWQDELVLKDAEDDAHLIGPQARRPVDGATGWPRLGVDSGRGRWGWSSAAPVSCFATMGLSTLRRAAWSPACSAPGCWAAAFWVASVPGGTSVELARRRDGRCAAELAVGDAPRVVAVQAVEPAFCCWKVMLTCLTRPSLPTLIWSWRSLLAAAARGFAPWLFRRRPSCRCVFGRRGSCS